MYYSEREQSMWSNEQRIEFAVNFTAANLDFYRTGDWLNLREDIKAFLGVFAVGEIDMALYKMGLFTPLEQPLPDDMTEGNLRALQADMKGVLEFFVEPAGTVGGDSVRFGSMIPIN